MNGVEEECEIVEAEEVAIVEREGQQHADKLEIEHQAEAGRRQQHQRQAGHLPQRSLVVVVGHDLTR